jgi:hypothetical protein
MDIRLMRTHFARGRLSMEKREVAAVPAESRRSGDPEIAGQRWRDATAELEYAERRGAPPAEIERLAGEVIEARVAMFQAGVSGGWQLPDFLQAALDRDRQLLKVWPASDLGTPQAESAG